MAAAGSKIRWLLAGAAASLALTPLALAPAAAQDLLGWTFTPELAEEGEGSELDRLSRSPSGALGADIYDTAEDNPLTPVSVTLRALDKITARYTDLEVPIGEEVAFGALTVLPRTCNKRPPEEFPETTVFLEVFSTGDDVQGRRVRGETNRPRGTTIAVPGQERPRDALFRGWMFASSPALNPLEHPVYDVWVIDCKMVAPDI